MVVLTTVRSDVESGSLPAADSSRAWAEAVSRAHAILTQTLPDELLDELATDGPAHHMPFRLPPILFG